MAISLSLDQLLTLLGLTLAGLTTIGGGLLSAIWWLLERNVRHLDERLARIEGGLARVEEGLEAQDDRLDQLQVELPLRYVARDTWHAAR